MAEGKRGFLQSILRLPGGQGAAKAAEGLPAKGPLQIHKPKVFKYDTRYNWLLPHRIKYRGLMDLDRLYRVMALWFKERRYELHERLYKSKPPELEMTWEAERKRTSWVREVVSVNVHMWGEYDIEAIVKGKKKKMANVRAIITITCDIEAPYADIFGKPRWTASNIERRLSYFFRNWVMQREVGGLYWDRLYYELYDLYGLIKETLKFGAK